MIFSLSSGPTLTSVLEVVLLPTFSFCGHFRRVVLVTQYLYFPRRIRIVIIARDLD